jgi:hypothetical protein
MVKISKIMRNFSSILIFKEKFSSLHLYYTHYPRYNIKNKSKNNHFGEYYQKKKKICRHLGFSHHLEFLSMTALLLFWFSLAYLSKV